MNYNFPAHINNDTFDGVTFSLKLNGLFVDLTGAIIRMQLRKLALLPVALELNTTDAIPGIVITDALNGEFQIVPQIISVACPDQYKYDIQITFPDLTVRTYIDGFWKINPDITQ